MTSLAKQLNAIASANSFTAKQNQRPIESLLFQSARELADTSTETLHAIAENGLMELISVDPNFVAFENTLFSMQLPDRFRCSPEESDRIGLSVRSFLMRVSPFVTLRAFAKCIDYLVRRFKIHEMEYDALLMCVLPYHETELFLRVASICFIRDDDDRWRFLKNMVKEKTILPRRTLIRRCVQIPTIIWEFSKLVIDTCSNDVKNDKLISFYTTLMIEFFQNQPKMSDNLLLTFFPYLFDALKMKAFTELQLGAFLLVAQISSKTQLSEESCSILMKLIARHNPPSHIHCGIVTIAQLVQAQNAVTELPKTVVSEVFKYDDIIAVLQQLSTRYVMCKFFTLASARLIKFDSLESLRQVIDLLQNIADLPEPTVQQVAKLTVKNMINSAHQEACQSILRVLHTRYSNILSSTLSESLKGGKQLARVVQSSLGSADGDVVMDETTLAVGLAHADASIRMASVKELIENHERYTVSNFQELILQRLQDSSNNLVTLLLNATPLMSQLPAEIFDQTLKMLIDNKNFAVDVRKSAVKSLFDLVKREPSLQSGLLNLIFEHFVLAFKKRKISSAVLESCAELANFTESPLLSGLCKAIASVKINIDDKKTVDETNMSLLNAVAGHLSLENLLELSLDQLSQTATEVILAVACKLMQHCSKKESIKFGMFVVAICAKLLPYSSSGSKRNGSYESDFAVGTENFFQKWLSLYADRYDKQRKRVFLTILIHYTLLTIVSHIPTEKAQSWLYLANQTDFERLIYNVFALAACTENTPLVQNAIQTLFKDIVEAHIVEFLLSVLVHPFPTRVRVVASEMVLMFFKSFKKYIDFQMFHPLFLMTLMDESSSVRQNMFDALICSKRMLIDVNGKTGLDVIIKKPTSFYSHLDKWVLCSTDESLKVIETLEPAREEIIASPTAICDWLKRFTYRIGTLIFSKLQFCHDDALLIKFLLLTDELHTIEKVRTVLKMFPRYYFETNFTPRDIKILSFLFGAFHPDVANQLNENGAYISLFQFNLTTKPEALRLHVLKVFSADFFKNLKLNAQCDVFNRMVEIVFSEFSTPKLVDTARKLLQTYQLPFELIEAHLDQLSGAENTTNKRSKIDNSSPTYFDRMAFTLELIKQSVQNCVTDKITSIIPQLFDLLAELLSVDCKTPGSSVEYSKQMLLTILLDVMDVVLKSKLKVDESALRIDMLVQCIRVSDNPQTHNQALLLMSQIAQFNPDKVLLNIIPVFTFMGTNVVRQDDNYSFFVTKQTIDTIIPPLVSKIKETAKNKQEIFLGVQPVIGVFVDALPHIPKHRQLRLFSTLIQTLSPELFLEAIVALVLSKFGLSGGKHSKSEELASEFTVSLCNYFPLKTSILPVIYLLNIVNSLPSKLKQCNEDQSQISNFLGINGTKPFLEFREQVMQFIGKFLSSESFTMKVNQAHGKEIEDELLNAMESLLNIIGRYNKLLIKSGDDKYVRLVELCYVALDTINSLFSTEVFVKITIRLLEHSHSTVRQKAILLFNTNFQKTSKKIKKANAELFIQLVSPLASTANAKDETDLNKQNSLLALGLLCQEFHETNPALFVESFSEVIGENALQCSNVEVQVSSLACVATMVQNLGPRIIGSLNSFVPAVMDLALLSIENTNRLLQTGALSALNALVTKLPQFMSSYMDRILAIILNKNWAIESEQVQNDDNMALVKNVRATFASKVAARVLFPALFAFNNHASESGSDAMSLYFELFGAAVTNLTRDDLLSQYKPIFKFFLTSFDIRLQQHDITFNVDAVETASVHAFIQLVMKLNETMFKPLFLKLVDWSSVECKDDENKINSRQLLFYKLVDMLLDNLKSIFAPYFAYVIDAAVQKLSSCSETKTITAIWPFIMKSFHKAFLYDNDQVFNEDKLIKILSPTVNQLTITEGGREVYLERIQQYIIPTLGQLAVIGRTDPVLKQLNHQVLMQTRSDKAVVRLAALKVLHEFYTRLGDDFVIYLPETVPFLAEFMEDDDEQVEKACQELTVLIEEYLGESLREHLK